MKKIIREYPDVLRIALREKEDEPRRICGRAIVFDTPTVLYSYDNTEVREIIHREAVTQELLDSSDIKMTLFHNRERILARSNKGKGTLSYEITDGGVDFSFASPDTSDGEYAYRSVELGNLSGCSFAFGLADPDKSVDREHSKEGDIDVVTYHVRSIDAIYDFCIAADPAYPTTSVEAREGEVNPYGLKAATDERSAKHDIEKNERIKRQIRELREL